MLRRQAKYSLHTQRRGPLFVGTASRCMEEAKERSLENTSEVFTVFEGAFPVRPVLHFVEGMPFSHEVIAKRRAANNATDHMALGVA